jgi:hypothetical protein
MTGDGGVADGWYKSTASASGGCVEVRLTPEHVHVRDTKDKLGAILTFTHAEWQAFLAGVRLGEFDLPEVESA